MKRRVLFVCTANSARSLMAEALLKHMAGDRFEVASAGTEPAGPHPMALQVLKESGIEVDGLHSKSLADLQEEEWDYVITLCEKAANECGSVCPSAQQIAWDFPDPVPSNRHAIFALTLKELKERIGLFTLVHQKETGMKPMDYKPADVFRALGEELRLAMLMLIRDQKKLCVNELTAALDAPQPKISRHLATLREAGLLETERRGQWVFYYLHPQLPPWVLRVLDETAESNPGLTQREKAALLAMPDRPGIRLV
ncbi:metalloregulator ArsR/SmtB family transcription factor [Marinobacter lutaoensis]|jgi:ArsR family transcriptional regulator|uniref:metalloregulator ArsR/SmtB family transcription factor n=1 Tax=Marinobacter lutaoensis TaxID=135739 RepID=UPI000C099E92|nr:metalloregulator ArsR/SmtB family transcription factor [Marinobacter lutaoensis]MBE02104.1 arsenate reductase [Marinobacter sp.]MBI42826.1 arsenate reductase [Oceanospirillales bacterium]NVD36485.1 metalloregulator ArsR/SmtB family transcription factor [Marinobacter lutaoensis]|tara:strand:- start:11176 stop:11940 length:765 start_codon:yes stop_codon:yes gene_type:complete